MAEFLVTAGILGALRMILCDGVFFLAVAAAFIVRGLIELGPDFPGRQSGAGKAAIVIMLAAAMVRHEDLFRLAKVYHHDLRRSARTEMQMKTLNRAKEILGK